VDVSRRSGRVFFDNNREGETKGRWGLSIWHRKDFSASAR